MALGVFIIPLTIAAPATLAAAAAAAAACIVSHRIHTAAKI